jgi:pescadillo protein
LLFVIPAFGGVVSWEGEGSPIKESDESITHQIVDRPTQGHLYLSREYVQPQWVYDCVNARILLPPDKYMVGRIPPPHLSPFVDNEAEGYIPDYATTIKQLQAAVKSEVLPLPGVGLEDSEDPQKLLAEGFINRQEAIEAAEKKKKMVAHEKRYHDELKMELQGSDSSNIEMVSAEDTPAMVELPADGQQISAETEMPRTMMSRKKRGLLEAIERGKEKKQAGISRLKERKKKIVETQKSAKH